MHLNLNPDTEARLSPQEWATQFEECADSFLDGGSFPDESSIPDEAALKASGSA